MNINKLKGFTLIEVMIVVAIVAILAALAQANYSKYAFRTRRADGKDMLMKIAAAQERHYTTYNTFATSITAATTASGLGYGSSLSDNGYYNITIAAGAGATYTLLATPQGAQANDVCGILTIDNASNKAPVAGLMPQNSNGNCW